MQIGDYVIVRARDAGVHAGVYHGHNGREVRLSEARRLWRWRVQGTGITLSDLAVTGIDANEWSRVSAPVADLVVLDACEIIATTHEAEVMLRECPTYVR